MRPAPSARFVLRLRPLLVAALVVPATGLAGWTNVAGTTLSGIQGSKDGGAIFADVNGDGFVDLVVNTSAGPRYSRLLISDGNLPNPKFVDETASRVPAFEWSVQQHSVVVADWNNDGYPDLLRSGGSAAEMHLGSGPPNYTFGNPTSGPDLTLTAGYQGMSSLNPVGTVTADLNRDGWLDLVTSNGSSGPQIFMNPGNGSVAFTVRNMSTTGLPDPTTGVAGMDFITTADWDVDGWPDLGLRLDGAADLWQNDGSGTFTSDWSFDYDSDSLQTGGITFCDFDNDGDLDVLWTDGGWDNTPAGAATNEIWQNNGSTFAPTGKPSISSVRVNDAACGDIDNDGDLDLFLATDGADMLFRNVSSGSTIQLTQDTTFPTETVRSTSAAMADYDNDGDLDIYVNRDGGNALWRSDLNDSDYLFVDVQTTVSSCPSSKISRSDVSASVRLYSSNYAPLSGVRQVDGGHGRGTQAPAPLHLGLPAGPNTEYYLWVGFTHPARDGGYVKVTPRDLPAHRTLVVNDADPDGDGLRNSAELADSPTNTDPDGDGFENWFDDDSDGDGLSDADETIGTNWCSASRVDTDTDGTPDYLDTDSDNDGLSDEDEAFVYGTSPINGDSDGDRINDGDEVSIHGTDPNDSDSDDDGLDDYEEAIRVGTNPNQADSDGDGMDDLFEVGNIGSPVNTDNDSLINANDPDDDGDGVSTVLETLIGSWPPDTDTDGDLIPNYLDNNDDGDDLLTIDEDTNGNFDWFDDDADGDDIPDFLDPDIVDPFLDSDGDGITDVIENTLGLNPNAADTDGDRLTDGAEIGDVNNPKDSDGDGLIDANDPDDDGDGLNTTDEGFTDNDGDGYPNYLDTDSDNDGAFDGTEGLYDSDGDGIADFLDNGAETVAAHGTPPGGPDHRGFGCATPVGGPTSTWWLLGIAPLLLRRRETRR